MAQDSAFGTYTEVKPYSPGPRDAPESSEFRAHPALPTSLVIPTTRPDILLQFFNNWLQGDRNGTPAGAAFLLPNESGYAAHSNFVADRLAGPSVVFAPQSFLLPTVPITPSSSSPGNYHLPQASSDDGETPRIRGGDSLVHALESAIGAVCFPTRTGPARLQLQDVEQELDRRLSLPWLLPPDRPPRQRRVCVVLDPISPHVTRTRWEGTAAVGVKVVILSSGSWWTTDVDKQGEGEGEGSYPDLDHLREGFVSIDLTPDDGLTQRIVDAVRAYPLPIDGLFTPTDAYLVSVARAAGILGLLTNGPNPFGFATDKALTRQLVDPDSTESFAVESLVELDARLSSQDTTGIRFPVISKPAFGRGSQGVFLARDPTELRRAVADSLKACLDHGTRVLIESYVDGPEVDVNLILRDGRLLYGEVVDDFPSPAELSEGGLLSAGDSASDGDKEGEVGKGKHHDDGGKPESNAGLFVETQTVFPSKLPQDEQNMLVESMLDVVRLQGFHTGVFHCEARVRNSRMKYVLQPGQSIPDLQLHEDHHPNEQTPTPTMFLHEVNARPPGFMSSAASLVAQGIDFWVLQVLCAVGDWERYEALAQPFLVNQQDDNNTSTDAGQQHQHVLVTNTALQVHWPLIHRVLPTVARDDLHFHFVDRQDELIPVLAERHPNIARHIARYNTVVVSRSTYGSEEPDAWLWGTTAVLCVDARRGRADLLDLAVRFAGAYDPIVEEADQAASSSASSAVSAGAAVVERLERAKRV
ncbi:uncharacterized protein C8A04DRAFT_30017 [Dichotomopilus funicola]|uniref:ATP-grasp domain-containing protein n=1 Tax=Dichotomopilus funicola TaxID=1934379 RepID=A0AAN6ZL19_9PEZI|nr:hypothetical protein C8A04DRAFT_30017 [Dichotomopilus funicola]